MNINARVVKTSVEEFKTLLKSKKIFGATLYEVMDTKKPLYIHPNTKQYFTKRSA